MAVNREWAGELDNSSTNQLQNLHHDKLRAPERVVTVLIYLSDAAADGLSGGDTLFPCARTAMDAPPSALCRRLERAYADGDLFLSPPNGIYKSIECFDTAAAGAASLLCSVGGTDDEWDSVLRVSPARGSAVVFFRSQRSPTPPICGTCGTAAVVSRVARSDDAAIQGLASLKSASPSACSNISNAAHVADIQCLSIYLIRCGLPAISRHA